MTKIQTWHLYIVSCSDSTYYTGIAINVERRIKKHNSGRGAKYTSMRRPVTLLYSEEHPDQSSAMKRELEVKKWSRERKAALSKGN